jgi:hypothetical protein
MAKAPAKTKTNAPAVKAETPKAKPVQTPIVIISAGQTRSDPVDCTAGIPIRINMPDEWTPANLTMSVSNDGNTFDDLYDLTGNEIMINVVPGTTVIVPHGYQSWIRFRSGTSKAPVIQEADRQFTVILQS